MASFTSFAPLTKQLLTTIVASDELHAKWLNTLSFLENCGARKIAACEHPTLVKEEMLKHAAEEFRHAHHLKRQIEKVSSYRMETYSLSLMLGGISTLHYLAALDLKASQYLKASGLSKNSVREAAYLLVRYSFGSIFVSKMQMIGTFSIKTNAISPQILKGALPSVPKNFPNWPALRSISFTFKAVLSMLLFELMLMGPSSGVILFPLVFRRQELQWFQGMQSKKSTV